MSVISSAITHITGRQLVSVLWETITCGDTGEPFEIADWVSYVNFQAIGTFNSQTLTMQGSIDGTNYFSLEVPAGTAVTFGSAGGSRCDHLPRYIRPSLGGSSGGDVDVYMLLRKVRN